jgi:hypothetical protein
MSRGWFETADTVRVCSRACRILPAQAPRSASELWRCDRGRVAQLVRARRLQRQTGAYISSSGDQQEWPFVQVRVEYSLSSKQQRVAPSGTGWTIFRMSFQPRIGQSSRRFSGTCRHKPVAAGSNGPGLRGPGGGPWPHGSRSRTTSWSTATSRPELAQQATVSLLGRSLWLQGPA